MKRAGAQRGDDVPVERGDDVEVQPRHRDAWGTILGQAPKWALSPGIWAPDPKGRRLPGVRDVVFVGTSDDDLRDFPEAARQRVGYQLHLVQGGHDPADSTSTPTVGAGCRQMQVHDSGNDYRVSYVASIGDTVYVLHCSHEHGPDAPDLDLGPRYAQMSELIQTRRHRDRQAI